jgi:hypothetical protein
MRTLALSPCAYTFRRQTMPESSTYAKPYRIVLMPQGQFIMGYDSLTAAIAEAVRLNDQNKVKVPAGCMPYYAVLPTFTVDAARRL